jgi:hypothetical protein
MQAAGVIPITSGYAALEESQQTGIKLAGDVYDPEWQDMYLRQVTSYASNELTAREDTTVIAKQFDWDLVAETWNQQLTNNNEKDE